MFGHLGGSSVREKGDKKLDRGLRYEQLKMVWQRYKLISF